MVTHKDIIIYYGGNWRNLRCALCGNNVHKCYRGMYQNPLPVKLYKKLLRHGRNSEHLNINYYGINYMNLTFCRRCAYKTGLPIYQNDITIYQISAFSSQDLWISWLHGKSLKEFKLLSWSNIDKW